MLVAPASLNQIIRQKISAVAAVTDEMPAVVIIHELPDFTVRFMSKTGLELLDVTHDEIVGLSGREYFQRFLNMDDVNDYVPKISKMLEQNTDDSISYFQQVRTSRVQGWDWYL